MSYENYTLEDFLTDKEFKNWVLSPDNNAQLFWGTWMASHPDQKETILKARELILSYTFKEPEKVSEQEQGAILERILEKDKKEVSKSKIKRSILFAAAASILIGVSAICFQLLSPNKPIEVPVIAMVVKENPVGQKSMVRLPDGTKVWLNSESKIEFPETFGDERNVNLKGEAFFEVVKNSRKPFHVTSKGIVTTALGTSFNIRAYAEEQNVEVLLVTGEVSVETLNDDRKDQQEKIFIKPGEQVNYDPINETLIKSVTKDANAILWKDGIISFQKAGFEQIKETLERWYGVKIEVANLKRELHYTGDFENESLERVLERMAFTEKFTFEIDEDNIKIKFE